MIEYMFHLGLIPYAPRLAVEAEAKALKEQGHILSGLHQLS